MVLYGWWYLLGFAIVVAFWIVVMAPMERRHWQRRLRLMQDRVRRNEKRLRRERALERLKRMKRARGEN